jgi:hypothetical protein
MYHHHKDLNWNGGGGHQIVTWLDFNFNYDFNEFLTHNSKRNLEMLTVANCHEHVQ